MPHSTSESSRVRGALVAFGVAVLLLGGLTGAAWHDRDRAMRQDVAAHESLRLVPTYVEAILSYDYRTFDTNVATGTSFLADPLATAYARTAAPLRVVAIRERAVVRARVVVTSVV